MPIKDILFKTKVTGTKEVEQGFDGINVSAKDLQERIKQLDQTWDKLVATYGKYAAGLRHELQLRV